MDTYTGMVLAALIFFASLVSVELGISAAIIEMTMGVLAGNFLHAQQLDWVRYIASFGGILLTFLAGAEVDRQVMREKAKESSERDLGYCRLGRWIGRPGAKEPRNSFQQLIRILYCDLQTKFDARFVSPVPLYTATCG